MFGKRLNITRKYRGYTALYVANKIGYSLGAYRMYESSRRAPTLETLVKIANVLDVPIDFLLERDEYLQSLGVSVDVPLINLRGNPTK
jgi:Predicted transcriptional regulators